MTNANTTEQLTYDYNQPSTFRWKPWHRRYQRTTAGLYCIESDSSHWSPCETQMKTVRQLSSTGEGRMMWQWGSHWRCPQDGGILDCSTGGVHPSGGEYEACWKYLGRHPMNDLRWNWPLWICVRKWSSEGKEVERLKLFYGRQSLRSALCRTEMIVCMH